MTAQLNRIGKTVGNRHTYYLYEERRLVAELNQQGRITRQYLYLADQPIAVIDTPGGRAVSRADRSAWGRIAADLATAWHAWFAEDESIAYLHNNHVGATELVTDAKGNPIWRAAYQPYGAVMLAGAAGTDMTNANGGRPGFTLNLRLPGQYADEETGLYYNDHRYYDPRSGRYLTPDPLGLRGGINGYAYAGNNPLRYIDPSGLILFAFDGTGNSENPPATDSISNVRKFYLAYDQQANGPKFYVTGIGTTNADMPYRGSVLSGEGFDQRVALGFQDLDKFVGTDTGAGVIDIDVVGFSRGAAEARVWINQLTAQLKEGAYLANGKTRCVNLRFEGLWDTVPHLAHESTYDFSIPASMGYAAQAVALNEHRGGLAHFNALSIMQSPGQPSSATRIEKGFIGSHADIGGGFGTGDLSDAALTWMIEQAKKQGIKFDDVAVEKNGWNIISNPIVHDKSVNRFTQGAVSATRQIRYGNGESVAETQAVIDGKRTADTLPDIQYFSNPYRCGTIANPDVGLVDMQKYSEWLQSYGMSMTYALVADTACKN